MSNANKKSSPPEKDDDKTHGSAEGSEGQEGAEGDVVIKGGFLASKKKLILFIALPVLLLIAVGAGLYFTGMLDSLLGKTPPVEGAEAPEASESGGHEAPQKEEGGHGGEKAEGGHGGASAASENFLAIPTMVVNLNTDDGTPRYLRLTVQLELEGAGDHAAVEAVIPRVIDQFQTYLRELRVKDLRGSAGIYRLQMELLWRVNQASAPIKIKDVLFQEILIQ